MGVPINNVTRRVVYAASGTGPYAFTFEILAAGDIAVYRDDTLLTLTTDYTVTIATNGTGSITLTASPTGATQIAIVGNRSIQRTTDFVTGGDFFANTLNDELDQQTIFAQQNAEGLGRALQAPQTDPTTINMTLPRASVRANKTLAFDSNGNPTTGEVIGDNRGNWASGTAYNKRDIVKDTSNGNIYYANTAHTSSGSQPISSNADSAKWDLIVDNASAGSSATAAAASASAAATSASNASTSATNAANSASAASTSASNASTSATNAANSATAASGSATTASTAATNAGNSATAAATSATNASNSASAASTSATNAANSASAASTSASNASTSATNAANSASSASSSASTATTQAGIATTQASNAATSASNAATSASNAATSETNAAASAAAAATALDNFDDRYLGAKSADPTVDNDGNALVTGALYYRTTTPIGMKVWDGSQWLAASSAMQAAMVTYEFVATAGQTTFSGTDANGATLSYLAGSIVVTLNGVALRPGDDYTATNGTSIVLGSAATLNDEIVVLAFNSFSVANAVAKTGDTMTGTLNLPSNGLVVGTNQLVVSGSNVGIGTASPGNQRLRIKQSADTGAASFSTKVEASANDTGLYFGYRGVGAATAADTCAISASYESTGAHKPITILTSDVERVRIDTSGNVGIGTALPICRVDVRESNRANSTNLGNLGVYTTNSPAIDLGGSIALGGRFDSGSQAEAPFASIRGGKENATNNNYAGYLAFQTIANGAVLVERARITSTGSLQVGSSSSDQSKLFIYDNSSNSGIYVRQDGAGPVQTWHTSGGTERARIDSSGNLLVGTTTATLNNVGFRLVSGSSTSDRAELGSTATTNTGVGWSMYSTGAGAYRFYVGYGGTIFATSTSITAISDQSLKENIRDLETGLPQVMALKPRRFDWKNGDGKDVAGFIAQEVESVLPELVYDYQYNAEETKKSLKMGDILPTLVKAIQEQQQMIEELKAKVTALEQAQP